MHASALARDETLALPSQPSAEQGHYRGGRAVIANRFRFRYVPERRSALVLAAVVLSLAAASSSARATAPIPTAGAARRNAPANSPIIVSMSAPASDDVGAVGWDGKTLPESPRGSGR